MNASWIRVKKTPCFFFTRISAISIKDHQRYPLIFHQKRDHSSLSGLHGSNMRHPSQTRRVHANPQNVHGGISPCTKKMCSRVLTEVPIPIHEASARQLALSNRKGAKTNGIQRNHAAFTNQIGPAWPTSLIIGSDRRSRLVDRRSRRDHGRCRSCGSRSRRGLAGRRRLNRRIQRPRRSGIGARLHDGRFFWRRFRRHNGGRYESLPRRFIRLGCFREGGRHPSAIAAWRRGNPRPGSSESDCKAPAKEEHSQERTSCHVIPPRSARMARCVVAGDHLDRRYRRR